jgi:uncharacterized protein (TIGR03083 family)
MTGTSTEPVLAALEGVQRRFGQLLLDIGPAGWDAPVPATPGWLVADMTAHMLHGERVALASTRGEPTPDLPARNVDEWTAAGIAEYAGPPRAGLIDAWIDAAAALRAELAGYDEEAWRGRAMWVAGPVRRSGLAQLRLHETWMHGRDVAEATGAAWPLDDQTLWWMADLAARVVPGTLTRAGRDRPGVAVLIRLGDREWLVGAGAGKRPAPGTEPGLVLEAEPLDFVLLAAGRRHDRPWRATGDQAPAEDIASTISTVG